MTKYIVHLIEKPRLNDFRADYFPRKFRYRKDALDLMAEVKRKGGRAVIQRVK